MGPWKTSRCTSKACPAGTASTPSTRRSPPSTASKIDRSRSAGPRCGSTPPRSDPDTRSPPRISEEGYRATPAPSRRLSRPAMTSRHRARHHPCHGNDLRRLQRAHPAHARARTRGRLGQRQPDDQLRHRGVRSGASPRSTASSPPSGTPATAPSFPAPRPTAGDEETADERRLAAERATLRRKVDGQSRRRRPRHGHRHSARRGRRRPGRRRSADAPHDAARQRAPSGGARALRRERRHLALDAPPPHPARSCSGPAAISTCAPGPPPATAAPT